jgi:dTDP-4-dehydrorhamnose reductase
MKTILITGASGFIGSSLAKGLKGYRLIGVDLNACPDTNFTLFFKGDLCNKKFAQSMFSNNSIDIIIHAAALKNVKECERQKKRAYRTNVKMTSILVDLAPPSTHFIYLSSDQVFDGKNGPYSEKSCCLPINYYGYTKRKSEEFLLKRNAAICRTALVFGKVPLNQRKLLDEACNSERLVVQGFIVQHVIRRLRARKKIKLPRDEYMNPTSIDLLLKQLKVVITRQEKGILHCCGGEGISRYEFGKRIARRYHLDSSLIVPIVGTDKLRPKDVSMEFSSTERRLGFSFDTINTMLRSVRRV